MDVNFFLRIRTKFIRDFYTETSFPFSERKRKIEAEEDPFEPPECDESMASGEPPFLDEWVNARESLDVLGQMCMSMLSSTLKLFLEECIKDLHTRFTTESFKSAGIGRPEENKTAFKKGWINGYRVYFRDKLQIEWKDVSSDLKLLEEIVLARNSIEHPESIAHLPARYWGRDSKSYRQSFFADEDEIKMLVDDPLVGEWLCRWKLDISKEKLWQAIDEVEEFCAWLDGELQRWPSQLEE
jgi:hypothetical protein